MRLTKVFAKAGLDNVTSAMCKYQQRFGLDVQCSALVINFNNIFSNGHLYRAGQSMNSLPSQILERWTTFHLRWSFVCRPDCKRQGFCIQNKCRPMRRLTRFLNPPKLGIEQNIVQHAFDEIGYQALRAPLRRRASSHRIALSPGLRQAPH